MPFLRYAITDRKQYGFGWPQQRTGLVGQAARLAAEGIDYLQLRERDLPAQDLIGLAREILNAIRQSGSATRLLINARADIALAAAAHGLHLPSSEDQLRPAQIHTVFEAAGRGRPTISVACHTLSDVARARDNGADLILFGPIFEKVVDGKNVLPGVGLEMLQAACHAARNTPVLALGGITAANSDAAIAARAAGIAAIRLFR